MHEKDREICEKDREIRDLRDKLASTLVRKQDIAFRRVCARCVSAF